MNGVETKSSIELVLHENGARPVPAQEIGCRPLEVNVLFTDRPATVKAMASAAKLARGLNARLRLVVAQVVGYAVPLESPPVLVEFQEALFREMAKGQGVETRVDIFLCRDAEEAFVRHLAPRSVVVLGSPRRWWRTREERLAGRLRRKGHDVLIVYGKEHTHA
jgi:hypothetical protein